LNNYVFFIYCNNKIIIRVAGAGRFIPDPRGNQEIKYAWNMGQATNNQAEEYAIFMGVQLAKGLQLQQLIILGDSNNTIWRLIKGGPPTAHPINIIKKKKI
jgi:ribonuclease HI